MTAHSEDSNICNFKRAEEPLESDAKNFLFKEKLATTESKMFLGLPSMCQLNPGNEFPSLRNELVCGNPKNSGRRRIHGGAISKDTISPESMEPRFKIGSSHRVHFRPSCGHEPPETRAKQRSAFKWQTFKKPQASENPLLESLLSSRSLVYSNSSRSQKREQSTENVHFKSYPPEFDISRLNLPEIPNSSAEEVPEVRCSRGMPFPSLGSSHTFTNIWRRKAPRAGCSGAAAPPTGGGLYGRMDKLKFQPIDQFGTGYSLEPLFQGSKAETQRRIQYFATKFDGLCIEERMLDTELRFHQLRILHAESDDAFFKHFQEHPATGRLNPRTKDTLYSCPIGGRCCPLVTDETILSHKLTHHLNERGLELRELFMGDRLLLIFNPRSYAIGRNSCMIAMGYAGVYEDHSTMPGKRFMHTRNRKLPAIFARYRKHLPLFVMICRNRRSVVDGPREQLEHENTGDGSERYDDDDDGDVLTVWVVSVNLTVPVHAMVTVLNRRMDATKTCVMQVRSMHKNQNSLKIMQSTCGHYMRIDEQDLRILTSDGTEPLYLEVTVKEYAGTLPRNAGEN